MLQTLECSPAKGLSAEEARLRRARHGPNRLRHAAPRSVWRMLCEQFANLIVALLLAAAAVAFAFGENVEGTAILAVILINAAIGFATERRAVRSMEALRALGQTRTNIRRSGVVNSVPAEELVPGDLLVLDAGDVLTADARIVSSSRLQADESALTGESLPVEKGPEAVPAATALPERTSMLFKGTALTHGSGEAVVVATGMATELGGISSLVSEAKAEVTPLERRLDRLARRLIGLTLVIAALVSVAVVATGQGILFAVEIGIALAVATIPEGLPIVATVALARGMWRMARRNALIEHLAAVETLGSTTVLLTDKTGTLTENRMTLAEVLSAEGRFTVEGTGLDLRGRFLDAGGAEADLGAHPALAELLRAGALCNNATLTGEPAGAAHASGDPTEVALLVGAAKAGIERAALAEELPEVRELAFDAETKRMATIHGRTAPLVVFAKGAPETVVPACERVRTADGTAELTEGDRGEWLGRALAMAARGERVLALARAEVLDAAAFDFGGLVLLGLAGILDPPRQEVRRAIDTLQEAGIRAVMVTGDHGATAFHVASAVGLIDPEPGGEPEFVDGRELPPIPAMSAEAAGELLAAPVIARATPAQKLDLIGLHQRAGEVVAMTGDGVNDAPALKKADIGIAMGLRGTQVAREAADMVLADDDLGSLIAAVEQGRAIFANIRKFVVYLMSCNVSEIFVVALGAVLPGPHPLLPLQILFLNLVTDVFPALALGVCEGSPALMQDPPRDPDEPILTRGHWRRIFLFGGVLALSVVAALGLALEVLGLPGRRAATTAFLTLALSQLWHVFSMRNPRSGWLRNEITANPWVWGALALCVGLLVAAVHWAPVAAVLALENPGPQGWALGVGLSLVPLIVGQLGFLLRRRRRPAPRLS